MAAGVAWSVGVPRKKTANNVLLVVASGCKEFSRSLNSRETRDGDILTKAAIVGCGDRLRLRIGNQLPPNGCAFEWDWPNSRLQTIGLATGPKSSGKALKQKKSSVDWRSS